MSTRTSTANPVRRTKPAGRGNRRLSLKDAKIRTKLSLILVVPVVAIVSLAAVRLFDSVQRATDAQLVASLTGLSSDIAETTQALQHERMAAARFLGDRSSSQDPYNDAIKVSDAAVQAYHDRRASLSGLPGAVRTELDRIDDQLGTLDGLRQQVLSRQGISMGETVVRYRVVIDELVTYHGLISQFTSDPELADALRAMAAFAQAKAQASDEQVVGYTAIQSGDLDDQQYNNFVATLTGQQSAMTNFALYASDAQRTLVDNTITADVVQLVDRVAQQMGRSVGESKPLLSAEDAARPLGALVDLMRFAEQQIDAQLISRAKQEQSDVTQQVIIESVLVFLALVLAIALAFLLARAMARSLTRLRQGALQVADRDLPEAVSRLRDVRDVGENSPEEIAQQMRDPIRVDSRDEIGQVAQAFNVVHREAVRVAAEQAALRTSVSAMFLNLARRSQALVDRMIGELDSIERGEEDPKRLAQLFQLDHLATRMRRNDENLLVLAGADSSAPRREDAPLADVVRAAQSEVEQYNRIEFGTIDQDVSVASHAVNDVVRLLAELFDNATRFSPPNAVVLSDGRRIGDYVLLQIEDRGLGIPPSQLTAINRRLAEPPSVDVSAFRMMGLAVVARLASRHNIKVELRPNPDGGTITSVSLPTPILILPRLRGREPVVTRPRSPLAVERGPAAAPAAGWPMPQLPGLAQAPALPGGVGTATLGDAPEPARQEWTPVNPAGNPVVAPAVTPPAAVPPPAPTPAPVAADALTASQPRTVVDDTAELPIFRATEAVWFRSHGRSATQSWPQVPPAGSGTPAGRPATAPSQHQGPAPQQRMAPPPAAAQPPTPPPPAPAPPPVTPAAYHVPAAPPPPAVPRQRTASPDGGSPDEAWHTAADDGWRAAAAAAAPSAGGTTRSGLPKRVPSAQLVPGGVDTQAARARTRRTPDEVRGLLSAYHRGVQRGRAGAGATHRPTDEEINR